MRVATVLPARPGEPGGFLPTRCRWPENVVGVGCKPQTCFRPQKCTQMGLHHTPIRRAVGWLTVTGLIDYLQEFDGGATAGRRGCDAADLEQPDDVVVLR